MALHHSLRDLVSVRGAGVVDEAEEFRGVLDDFLAEDEATLGELNLLVDAVRLGALRRVLDVMANGAAPQAAIREAGAALARDRGTDDPTRSCWALASLCFALGKADESLVRAFLGDTGTVSTPGRPVQPTAPAPYPVNTGPTTAERPTTEVLPDQAGTPSAPPRPAPGPAPAAPTATPTAVGGPVPPVIPEQRSSRAGVYLLVVLVGLLLGGLVATGIILLRSDGDTGDDDPGATNGRTSEGSENGDPPLITADEMIVPYKQEDPETSAIYAVDAITGGSRQLTTGDDGDRLPTVSPDRRVMTYISGEDLPVLNRFDPESASTEPFFSEPGPCDHALRPAWSLDGTQIALVCTGADKDPDGIWVSDADGNLDPEPVVSSPLVDGAPTWVSDTEFIFAMADTPEDVQPDFWRGYADGRPAVRLELDIDGQLSHIDWSPEAGKLLFLVSPSDDEIGDVWIMDADGANPEPVANGSYGHPVWSPDGRSIGLTVIDLETDTAVLGYVTLDDPDNPVIVEDPPPGEPGTPVWATR